ncbi:uncharacterized protein LOC113791795 [Dermatophagoides pteronyssinus]|uniref:Zinc finger CCCH domain-containing protein 10-like n=1 Tax=Dermatophagoides pteronyssinus TaxID=6956 RepID=A0A6P6XW09_DERPT|nr:zinc finger CCCH domain-containing protein 10-like [Dermatophagoides pteronyssinus]
MSTTSNVITTSTFPSSSSMTMTNKNENDYQTNMNGTNTSNNNNNNNGYESSSINNNTKNDSNNDLTNNSTTTAGGDSVASTATISATTSNNQSSNNNDNSSNNNQQDDVCRDYLRNVCRRGKSCRYKHPDINDTDMMKNKEPYVFCHDYQNRECRRDNCRFLHCTKQEEEIYRSTGKLPPHIQAQYPSDDRNVAPVCKDYLNNTCRRGPRCKYRHPLPANDSFHQYGHHHHPQQLHHPSSASNPVARVGNQFNGRGGNYPNSHMVDYPTHYNRAGTNSATMMPSNYGSYDGYADATPQNKRKRYDPQSSMYHLENNGPYSGAYQEPPPPPLPSGNVRNTYGGTNPMHDTPYGASSAAGGYANSQPPRSQQPPTIDSSRSYLEEENAALRRRIDDLKKQVQDLLSTNEYLLEQMNQIRASGQAAVAAACGAPHGNTSVASLQPQPTPGSVQSTASIGMSAPITLQAPAQAAVAIGPLPPVSIVSSIASISLPTVSAPVTLVPNSSAAAYTPSMATMHSSNPWPLGVDQLLKNDL